MKKIHNGKIDININNGIGGARVSHQNNIPASGRKKKRFYSLLFGKRKKYKHTKNNFVGSGFEKQKFSIRLVEMIISFCLFMVVFGVPLFFTGLALQGIVFEKEIYFYFWILLATVLWVFRGVMIGEMKIRKTPLDIPLVAFWAVYVVATFLSVDKWHSFWGFFGDPSRGLINITAMIVFYYLVVSNFTIRKMLWMLGGLIVSNLIISSWTIMALYNVNILPKNINILVPLSLIGTMTGLKIFIGAMLPILMMVAMNMFGSPRKIFKILGIFPLIIILMNLFLLLIIPQKTVLLIVLFGVGFFLLYILANIVSPKGKGLLWIPMGVFVLIMAIFIIGGNRFTKIALPPEVMLNAKMSWDIAKESAKNHFFFGSGPATYGYDFSMYKPKEFNQNIFYQLKFYQGTGLFFEGISTVGLLGVLMLLVVAITYINVALYLITQSKHKNKMYSLGLLSATLILLVSSFLIKIEGTIIVLSAILTTLSVATLLRESNVEEKYIRLSLKASPKFALTMAFVFIVVSAGVATLFVYVGKAYVADLYAGKIKRLDLSEKGSIQDMVNAISLNPREGRYYSLLGQQYMLLANKNAVKSKNSKDKKNIDKIRRYIDQSLSYARAGVKYMPNDTLAISTLAQIEEGLGVYDPKTLDTAIDSYKKLSELEPNSPTPYYRMGQIKLTEAITEKDKNKKKEIIADAEKYFQEAINRKDNYSEAYFYLALSKNALLDRDGAIDAMTKAVKINPNNTDYLFNLAKIYQDRKKDGDLDNAQKIFEYLLKVNPDNVTVNFSLAYLLDSEGKKDEAVKAYQKTIDLISKSKAKNKEKVINQLRKMIENVKNGISNNQKVNVNDKSLGNAKQNSAEQAKNNETKPISNESATPTNVSGNNNELNSETIKENK